MKAVQTFFAGLCWGAIVIYVMNRSGSSDRALSAVLIVFSVIALITLVASIAADRKASRR